MTHSPRWSSLSRVLLSVAFGLGLSSSAAVGLTTSAVMPTLPPRLPTAAQPSYIRPLTACPDRLEDLTPLLLRDLPDYTNRVIQRSFDGSNVVGVANTPQDRPGYILLAGRPEFNPLTLGPGDYRSTQPTVDQPRQVFFTTLERQYLDGRSIDLQHYHWAFFAQTANGWLLVTLFSRIGDRPANQPPTPPQDTSQGAIAQSIRLWLRDCRSGAISPSQ